MSRERELLKQAVENFAYVQDMHLIVAIQKLLNQPEQEPLTREEISYGFRDNDADLDAESYWAGVKLAEKMHGIGGGE